LNKSKVDDHKFNLAIFFSPQFPNSKAFILILNFIKFKYDRKSFWHGLYMLHNSPKRLGEQNWQIITFRNHYQCYNTMQTRQPQDPVNNRVFRGLKAIEPLPGYVTEKSEYQLKKKDLYRMVVLVPSLWVRKINAESILNFIRLVCLLEYALHCIALDLPHHLVL